MFARKREIASRGFTLVELLVVIGIIAILISVLLPALSSARRSAASIKCLSNLKNLHNALLMYAGEYKNATPVGRQDDVNPSSRVAINQNNRYWVDMLYPYVVRKSASFPAFATQADADAYMKSILWCPTWLGEHPELYVWNPGDPTAYTNRFKNGYGMSIYFGFRPDYPNPDAMLPGKMQAMWASIWNGGNEGRYYKRNEITDQANRMIIADSNLWIVGMGLTNAQGDFLGQSVGSVAEHNQTPGGMNYDRYRHGKYPPIEGTRFSVKGGSMSYNALFVDGHAASLKSNAEGYKAIRMRYP